MTKQQIHNINTLIARYDDQWHAFGEYVVVFRDEWVPCILRAGGSNWDRHVYRATIAIQPLFVPFSTIQSLYMVAVDHPSGTWSMQLSSPEEIAHGVAEVIRSQLPKLTALIPVAAFRDRAITFLSRHRPYRREFRVERDLLGACCAMRDLRRARQHLEAATECLVSPLPDDPYRESLHKFRHAIEEGEESAFALVCSFKEEGCRRTRLPLSALTPV